MIFNVKKIDTVKITGLSISFKCPKCNTTIIKPAMADFLNDFGFCTQCPNCIKSLRLASNKVKRLVRKELLK